MLKHAIFFILLGLALYGYGSFPRGAQYDDKYIVSSACGVLALAVGVTILLITIAKELS